MQRCGDEGKRMDGLPEMPVAMPGMGRMIEKYQDGNKKEAMGTLAWLKVPVTITSLALVWHVSGAVYGTR